jgi:hypothetical protein
LNDASLLQGHAKSQAHDLKLGVSDGKIYHNVLFETKCWVGFDCLRQLWKETMLDQVNMSLFATVSFKSQNHIEKRSILS